MSTAESEYIETALDHIEGVRDALYLQPGIFNSDRRRHAGDRLEEALRLLQGAGVRHKTQIVGGHTP